MAGDNFSNHSWGHASGLEWVETRAAVQHPTVHGTPSLQPNKESPGLKISTVLRFCFWCVFFWLDHVACGILVFGLGIKPRLKARSPNHWPAREFPKVLRLRNPDLRKIELVDSPRVVSTSLGLKIVTNINKALLFNIELSDILRCSKALLLTSKLTPRHLLKRNENIPSQRDFLEQNYS